MKTILLAVVVFSAAFGGVLAYGWYRAPSGPLIAAEAEVKDAIVAELGHLPEAAAEPQHRPVKELYGTLQAAYRKMDATCSPEARTAYATAFANYAEGIERANETGETVDIPLDQMATMSQFVDAAARGLIVPADMPNRRFARMVAAVKDTPLSEAEKTFGRYKDDAGELVELARCERLAQEN